MSVHLRLFVCGWGCDSAFGESGDVYKNLKNFNSIFGSLNASHRIASHRIAFLEQQWGTEKLYPNSAANVYFWIFFHVGRALTQVLLKQQSWFNSFKLNIGDIADWNYAPLYTCIPSLQYILIHIMQVYYFGNFGE